MIKRLRSLFPLDFLYVVEATLIGLFFIQSLRYLIGAVYARMGSASLYPTLNPSSIDPTLPGLVTPDAVTNDLIFLAYVLAMPLVALLFGHIRINGRVPILMLLAVFVASIGRYVMTLNADVSPDVFGATLTVGGGLLYFPLLVRHRARAFPYAMILAMATDQLYRAWGDTIDPSWSASYLNVQLALTFAAILLSLMTLLWQARRDASLTDGTSPDRGLMPFWGGIGFGALLFLQLSLFALPNAIAGRSGTNFYTPLVPLVIVATLLPIVPFVRGQARRFISLFDSALRGWVWMLMTLLLIVIGLRLGGIVSVGVLVIAQFMLSMMWWWLYRPQAQKERNFGALWLLIGILVFLMLMAFDIFTYEYAYVRNFSTELDMLNPVVPSLLRGFRGLGIAVIGLAVFFAIMPMVTMQKRIAWGMHSRLVISFMMLIFVGLVSALAVYFARPPVVRGVTEPQFVRIGTYNIHSGFNEFFHFDLEIIARTIEFSGANVILLQEVEVGRMTSYGVDQVLWLARRLGMDARFFPTNEGLQGLAVLSNIRIVFDDGVLLTSVGNQTGLQRVQILPDANVITLYNVWLEPLLDTGNAEISSLEAGQSAQLNEIIGTIAGHFPDGRRGRMVIGGTFNNIPDSDIVRRMLSLGFDDAFADQQPELSATYRRTDVQARLDYLWTTEANNFQVVQSGVINDFSREVIPYQPSDHLLTLVDVRLR